MRGVIKRASASANAEESYLLCVAQLSRCMPGRVSPVWFFFNRRVALCFIAVTTFLLSPIWWRAFTTSVVCWSLVTPGTVTKKTPKGVQAAEKKP